MCRTSFACCMIVVEISSIERLVVSSVAIPSRRINCSASRTSYSQFGTEA